MANTTASASDADGHRGDERRRRDLGGPVEDRLTERLLHRQVAVDVLDLHGGVVHQNADRQGHAA
jgi:hypothetical protein